MATYLFAWNPDKWHWENLSEASEKVKHGRRVIEDWSIANKHAHVGDRAFLIKLGAKQPRGIFASGHIIREPYRRKHWDPEKAKLGVESYAVDIQFDVLLDPSNDLILDRELLNIYPLSNYHWDTQSSGVLISEDIARNVEEMWKSLSTNGTVPTKKLNDVRSLSNITREAVIDAIHEYEEKGKDNFLAEYGFHEARQYFLIYDGKEYPSKAIVGVAHKYVSSDNKPLEPSEFSGGKNTVERKLKDLGFNIRGPDISFWWVNHKQTFESEIKGGYIWSPKNNRDDSYNQTYFNLTLTHPGDFVFSYANGTIGAIGVVTAPCLEQKKPVEFGKGGETWADVGWIVPIKWHHLEVPISPKKHIGEIAPLLPDKYSPIQRNGNGNQGCYLASISEKLGKLLFAIITSSIQKYANTLSDVQSEIEADREEMLIENSPSIGETEKSQLITARRGQGKFRSNVERIESACRLTGVSDLGFLVASHIKPWKDSTNSERLDGSNGLLLSPHVDKLFDRGWISFTDNGDILCADDNIKQIMEAWGLNTDMNIGTFSDLQRKYLKYHRNNVFKKG
jgi:putative restriction endonuclease